jgi:hypothetical protein
MAGEWHGMCESTFTYLKEFEHRRAVSSYSDMGQLLQWTAVMSLVQQCNTGHICCLIFAMCVQSMDRWHHMLSVQAQ